MSLNLEKLQDLLINSDLFTTHLNDFCKNLNSDRVHTNIIGNEEEDEDYLNNIPDLITPPENSRQTSEIEKSETNDNKETKENDTKVTKENDTKETKENDTKVTKENDKKSCEKVSSDTDNFIYNVTNLFFSLMLCNDLYYILYFFNRSYLSLFILNCLIFLFYNNNRDIIIEYISYIIINYSKYLYKFKCIISLNFDKMSSRILNYFFSKNTQMILKFAYNITKNKLVNKYKSVKYQLFNPTLLTRTNTESVYVVSFYLNGETYKIPIVSSHTGLNKKQPPIMILNKNEEDVTQKLLQFMGPNYDFYGMILKPKHICEKNLYFLLEDGSEMNILENDLIVL